jgi:hypothetical protein
MNPQERQVRILAFVERYQQQMQDAPTVREIVLGSGVSTYANINQDVEALVQRGMLSFVSELVSGSEPFSSRQLRLTAKASGAGNSGARPSGAGPSGAGPSGATAPARGASSLPPRQAPPTAGASIPTRLRGAARQQVPPAQQDPSRQPGSLRPQGQTRQPASPRRQQAMPAAAGRARQAAPGRRFKLGTALPGIEWLRNLMPTGRPQRLALLAASLATLLFATATWLGEPLPAAPVLSLGSRSFPALVPGAILAWGISGFALGMALDRSPGWTWRSILRCLGVGIGAGALVMAWESLLRPSLAGIETSGLPNLLDGLVLVLPALLPGALLRQPGSAVLGISAAESSKILFLGGAYNFPFRNLVQVPLIAVPVELLFWLRGQDRGRGTMVLAGLVAGIAQVASSHAFTPGLVEARDWDSFLVSFSVGGMVAGLLVALLIEGIGPIAFKSGPKRPGGNP